MTRMFSSVLELCRGGVLALVVSMGALLASPAGATEADPSNAPVGVAPDYRIAAEDVLDVSVWKEPDLTKQVIVRPDGAFSYPLIGDVRAAGLTTSELETELRGRLSNFIPDAVVTVSVLELRGMRIYVTGKVRSPGQFQVGRYVDVLQAITLAGGFTPFADIKDIQIIRRDREGRETVFEFNYKEVERGRNLQQNIRLEADDVVLVP